MEEEAGVINLGGERERVLRTFSPKHNTIKPTCHTFIPLNLFINRFTLHLDSYAEYLDWITGIWRETASRMAKFPSLIYS